MSAIDWTAVAEAGRQQAEHILLLEQDLESSRREAALLRKSNEALTREVTEQENEVLSLRSQLGAAQTVLRDTDAVFRELGPVCRQMSEDARRVLGEQWVGDIDEAMEETPANA